MAVAEQSSQPTQNTIFNYELNKYDEEKINLISPDIVSHQVKIKRDRYSKNFENYVVLQNLYECKLCKNCVPLENIEFTKINSMDICDRCNKHLTNSKRRLPKKKTNQCKNNCKTKEPINFNELCNVCIDDFFRKNGFFNQNPATSTKFEKYKFVETKYHESQFNELASDQNIQSKLTAFQIARTYIENDFQYIINLQFSLSWEYV